MKWPWPAPQKGDISAIILLMFMMASVLIFYLVSPRDPTSNHGFGPGWECSDPGWGEPVCIKKPLAASEKPPRGTE
jgi:hypothetical protein